MPTENEYQKGTQHVPFSFSQNDMTTEEQLQRIEAFTNQMLSNEPDYFLVSLRIKPTNNVRVYLDGDHGLPIEKCVSFNRQLYKLLEESELFPPGEYSLEVSSPGVEEPLKMHRQYRKILAGW